jgi:hypothetical protein
MAAKTTLNAKNLEALGAGRLAELLVEISTGDAAIKRRLRLELAGAASPAEAAREIRKRLATIARGRTFIDWEKRKAFAADLDTQRRAILALGTRSSVAVHRARPAGVRAVRRQQRHGDERVPRRLPRPGRGCRHGGARSCGAC